MRPLSCLQTKSPTFLLALHYCHVNNRSESNFSAEAIIGSNSSCAEFLAEVSALLASSDLNDFRS